MGNKRISELQIEVNPQISDLVALASDGTSKRTTLGSILNSELPSTFGDTIINGDLTVIGTETIVSSSVLYDSGSTIFGDSVDDTHDFIGDVTITGSVFVSSSVTAITYYGDGSNLTNIDIGIDTGSFATTGSNTFIGDQTISGSLFVSGGTELGGDIFPQTPQGATLGTIDKPFRELYLQSGSISIESDTPGDPSAVISNINGNLEISVGGMRLVQPGNSFIAETGSFQYISGSLTQLGDYIRIGDTITTGSVNFSGSFEADLQENYVWLGDSNNRSTPTTLDTLAQSGSYVQKGYLSCFSTSSISLDSANIEQAIDFTSIWVENSISLVDNNKITFAEPGAYKLEFLATIENDTNNELDSWFWIKLNGTNFPNSSTKVTVRKRKSNGEHTHQLVSISILGVAQTAGDYVQVYWTGENTALGMPYEGAAGDHPATPSVTLNVIRVG